MKILIVKGDITTIKADALVNAANNELWMGAGVAGAIKRKGGVVIEEEAIKKGPIEHGGAVETTAGNLNAKYIIHAAGMRSDGYISEESLRKSVYNSLLLAENLKLKSIAFPAIGTGVAGFPPDECAKIMLKTIKEFNFSKINEVMLVLFDNSIYEKFIERAKKENIEI